MSEKDTFGAWLGLGLIVAIVLGASLGAYFNHLGVARRTVGDTIGSALHGAILGGPLYLLLAGFVVLVAYVWNNIR